MNILITGAGKGIGFAVTKLFAQNPNNKIYALSRNIVQLKKIEKNVPGEIIPISFDLKKLLEDTTLPDIIHKTDEINILINNAGLLINKNFENITVPEIQDILNINFIAPAILIRQCLDKFTKIGAHVLNIGSMGGFQGSDKFPGLSIYSASKAAIASLTECLASEFKDSGISFNCLAIGSVQTKMLDQAFPGYKAPLRPDEMAEFIVDFACTGHRFINGKVLPVALMSP